MSAVSCHRQAHAMMSKGARAKNERQEISAVFVVCSWHVIVQLRWHWSRGREFISPIIVMCCNNNKQFRIIIQRTEGVTRVFTVRSPNIIIYNNFRELVFWYLISIKHGWKNDEHLTCQNRFPFRMPWPFHDHRRRWNWILFLRIFVINPSNYNWVRSNQRRNRSQWTLEVRTLKTFKKPRRSPRFKKFFSRLIYFIKSLKRIFTWPV